MSMVIESSAIHCNPAILGHLSCNSWSGTDEPTTGGKSVPRPGVDDHMFASVQSFANYIQSHFTSSHDNNVPSMPGVSAL